MTRHVIGKSDEFADDTRRVVDVDGTEVAVFNVGGTLHAVRNACPHRGAPLCTLPATGMMLESAPDVYEWGRDGEIVRCPWHGFEFNLSDGKSVVAPRVKLRARVYQVDIEGAEVALYT